MNLPFQIGIFIDHQAIKMKHLYWRSMHFPPISADPRASEFPGISPYALFWCLCFRLLFRINLHVFKFFDLCIFTPNESFGHFKHSLLFRDQTIFDNFDYLTWSFVAETVHLLMES